MMKQLAMTALLAAALAAPSFAQPEPPADVQGRGNRPRLERMAMMEKLNLTEQQQAQVEKLRIDMQRKQVALQSKIRLARLDLKELYLADNPDKNAIEKKMKEVSDLQHQVKVAHLDHQFAVKNILTPEQQKVWKKHLMDVGMRGPGMRMEQRQVRIIERQGAAPLRQGRMMRWQEEGGKEVEVEVEH